MAAMVTKEESEVGFLNMLCFFHTTFKPNKEIV